MIELVLTVVYVALSAMILWRYRQSWRAEAKIGVVGRQCDANESRGVRLERLRCRLRTSLAFKRAERARKSSE